MMHIKKKPIGVKKSEFNGYKKGIKALNFSMQVLFREEKRIE